MLSDGLLVVVGIVLVVGVARIGADLATRLRQPRIAGQLVLLVCIGPTFLGGQIDGVVDGAQATGVVGALFPPLSVDVLAVLGALGLVLYVLLIGLTIDPRPMARQAGTIALLAGAIAAATTAVALVAAPWLRHDGGWAAPAADATAFALALSAALVANGVPVVARILEEHGLLRTPLGAIAISAGACVTTVALVASGVAIKGADAGAMQGFALVIAAAAALVAIVTAVATAQHHRLGPGVAVGGLLGLALAAGAAGESLLGTALVGPLVVGIAAHGSGAAARFVEERIGAVVRGSLLPIFLGFAALHTNLRELGPDVFAPVAVLLLAVMAAKLAAGYGAARATGFPPGDAGALAATLQCGGVMTIAISLAILDAGLITTRLHAALTLAGLVTTVVAGPLLERARPAAAIG